jgi:hypothetical protein
MQAEREMETVRRMGALIDLLGGDDDCEERAAALPSEAASTWSEAAVRRYFATGELPAAPADATADEQPGGGRPQPPSGPAEPPAAVLQAQMALSAEVYRQAAVAAGIPRRQHGLFPPADPVLLKLAADRSLKPFEKHLIGASGVLQLALVSWPVGDDAAERGIDLRYFIDTSKGYSVGARLVAAVRYSRRAAIGADCYTSVHGGAIETAFDETTAELVKISVAPTATTIDFQCTIKKPVPLDTSLLLECTLESIAPGGLRINTSGTLKDGRGMLLATAKAQLVDVAKLRQAQGTGV